MYLVTKRSIILLKEVYSRITKTYFTTNINKQNNEVKNFKTINRCMIFFHLTIVLTFFFGGVTIFFDGTVDKFLNYFISL